MSAYAPDIALTGGSWQPIGGVLRWVPDGDPEVPPGFSVSGLIACPTCHARVDRTCRTTGGNPRAPHVTRLAPRLCSCGSRLRWKQRLCDRCRNDAHQQTQREWRAKNLERNREYLRRWRAARRAERDAA